MSQSARMEQQVRNQARVLFWVSALLLITCASMTGTFGWSLGRSFYEKVIYTLGFVVADIGGAGLMAVSGTCAANKSDQGRSRCNGCGNALLLPHATGHRRFSGGKSRKPGSGTQEGNWPGGRDH